MSRGSPRVAILPSASDDIERAVVEGGGSVVDIADAEALVWTDPRNPHDLAKTLQGSDVEWVQLPFAGIESFFDAGVIDPNLTWTCAKGIYGPACAEHAVALMLAAARRLHVHARANSWSGLGLDSPEYRLQDRTVVVVGTGGIGVALVPMVVPLGMRVIGVNRSGRALVGAERTVVVGQLESVLPEADFVVVAAAHTGATHHLFDEVKLAAMKSDAWIVNVARGGLIDTGALVAALEAEDIGGAALDVTDPEPLPDGHPLWDLDNCLITPHVANTWAMGLAELPHLVRRNVAAQGAGERLEGLVDPELGY
ncbi:MAG: D-isomer specific 2-hydroxyacid dehydrogenase family protein [Actinomycetota bacterium]